MDQGFVQPRSLCGEVRRADLRQRAGELGEDRQVSVQPDAIQTTDAQREQCPFVLEVAELPFDGATGAIELRGALRLPRDQRVQPVSLDPPPSVESAAYFVAAEALTNVAKYARANTARVTATHTDGALVLTVEDDGIGGAISAPGRGLAGLEDRVTALDGSLTVASPPGGGTTVLANIPLPAPPADSRLHAEDRGKATLP
jgi:signal transduction histidine kinase